MPLSGHFLRGARGALATTLWDPAPGTKLRGALVGVPPFGDEMNKSRRMLALQARALAEHGIAVAVVDPFGTGDSEGEYANATWEGWRDDVRTAASWLSNRAGAPTGLWGMRLGALLAADAARAVEAALLLLWQPVASGRAYFNQFLRTASAQAVTAGAGADRTALRARIAQGECVEVGGYAIARDLLGPADQTELAALVPPCPVVWREIGAAAAAPALEAWRASGVALDHERVAGPSFWMTVEIEEAPDLVAATTPAVVDTFLRRSASR